MLPSDLNKTREIVFEGLPPGQAKRACELLDGLDGIKACLDESRGDLVLNVEYNVCYYTLESLENALLLQGFHLEGTLLQKLKRALVYYCEKVQRENLAINAPDAKSQQVFARVYEHHLHGDSDETPEEWREYR